jgi:hypothetical protein
MHVLAMGLVGGIFGGIFWWAVYAPSTTKSSARQSDPRALMEYLEDLFLEPVIAEPDLRHYPQGLYVQPVPAHQALLEHQLLLPPPHD